MEEPNEEELIRAAMAAIGRRKSERKTAAAQTNGKLGGRPKGTPMSDEVKAKLRQVQQERRQREKEERAASAPSAEPPRPRGRPKKQAAGETSHAN